MHRLLLVSAAISVATACTWDVPCEDDDSCDTGGISSTDSSGTGTPGPETSCEPLVSQPEFERVGTVVGRVTSPSGTVPVRSAVVEVDVDGQAAWMVTNCGEGGFELRLPPGSHRLTVTKGRWSASRSFQVTEDGTTALGDISLELADVRIGVIRGDYDDIGAMIRDVGIPFDEYLRPRDLFDAPASLAAYDVVFVNCGTLAGKGDDPYTEAQMATVRTWIEAGGTLYASDWEHELFEGAIPEALHFAANPRRGEVSTVSGEVMDREIQSILGKDRADLMFNLSEWAVIDAPDQALPLVMAKTTHDQQVHPMAALMPLGQGKAIYTSFHNEWQITDDMEILLYEMILSL